MLWQRRPSCLRKPGWSTRPSTARLRLISRSCEKSWLRRSLASAISAWNSEARPPFREPISGPRKPRCGRAPWISNRVRLDSRRRRPSWRNGSAASPSRWRWFAPKRSEFRKLRHGSSGRMPSAPNARSKSRRNFVSSGTPTARTSGSRRSCKNRLRLTPARKQSWPSARLPWRPARPK